MAMKRKLLSIAALIVLLIFLLPRCAPERWIPMP